VLQAVSEPRRVGRARVAAIVTFQLRFGASMHTTVFYCLMGPSQPCSHAAMQPEPERSDSTVRTSYHGTSQPAASSSSGAGRLPQGRPGGRPCPLPGAGAGGGGAGWCHCYYRAPQPRCPRRTQSRKRSPTGRAQNGSQLPPRRTRKRGHIFMAEDFVLIDTAEIPLAQILDATAFYVLKVASADGRQWAVKKRFSDFVTFREELSNPESRPAGEASALAALAFPEKTWTGGSDKETVKARKEVLNPWISEVVKMCIGDQDLAAFLADDKSVSPKILDRVFGTQGGKTAARKVATKAAASKRQGDGASRGTSTVAKAVAKVPKQPTQRRAQAPTRRQAATVSSSADVKSPSSLPSAPLTRRAVSGRGAEECEGTDQTRRGDDPPDFMEVARQMEQERRDEEAASAVLSLSDRLAMDPRAPKVTADDPVLEARLQSMGFDDDDDDLDDIMNRFLGSE
jgi:hypothetical protein